VAFTHEALFSNNGGQTKYNNIKYGN